MSTPRPLRVFPTAESRLVLADTVRASAGPSSDDGRFVQGTLAVDLGAILADADADADAGAGVGVGRGGPTCELPDPRLWAPQLARAIIEVMRAQRPAAHLLRWVDPQIYDVVARGAAVARRRAELRPTARRGVIGIRQVMACEPAAGVAEVSLVLQEGTRVRAMAMRLEGHHDRWRVTALQLG